MALSSAGGLGKKKHALRHVRSPTTTLKNIMRPCARTSAWSSMTSRRRRREHDALLHAHRPCRRTHQARHIEDAARAHERLERHLLHGDHDAGAKSTAEDLLGVRRSRDELVVDDDLLRRMSKENDALDQRK